MTLNSFQDCRIRPLCHFSNAGANIHDFRYKKIIISSCESKNNCLTFRVMLLDINSILILLGIGLFAGVVNTLAGGGSLVTLPVLILFLGLDEATANGTNRLMVISAALVASYGYRSKKIVTHPYGLYFGLVATLGAIIGAGATSGGVMDASNLLKPALAKRGLQFVGSTTYKEFRGIFEKDRALSRRFQKVEVTEPTIDETYSILKGLKGKFEEHHEIKYTDSSLKAAASLASKYINDRFLPDKAIDVVDEAGARQKLISANKRKKTINELDIEKIVASIARIPEKTVSSSDKKSLEKLPKKNTVSEYTCGFK